MERLILAHDLGTSGNKASLFSESGELIGSCTESYGTEYMPQARAEQNPEDWWRAVRDSTARLLAGIDDKNRISVISFSGQMQGCLCVDKKGNPLRNSLIYSDQRSGEQAATLVEKLGAYPFFQMTGHKASSSYSLSKLMWIRDNEPEIFRHTHKMLQAKDYITLKMTGNFIAEYNDASGTNAMDLKSLNWSDTILDAAGIDRALLPDLLPSDGIAGTLLPDVARELGLPEGIPVVAGAGDGGCATIGIGCVAPGISYNCLGSSSWISTASTEPLKDPEMKTFTWAHPVTGLYQPCGTMQTAGSALAWLKRELGGDLKGEAEKTGQSFYALLDRAIEGAEPGAGGLLFLPYLLGERSPWWNSQAKGVFLGLSLHTSYAQIARAVMEGISMNLGLIKDIMSREMPMNSLRLMGGGAASGVWNSILADVFGVPVEIPNHLEEATSMGAAIIGGVGAEIFKDFSAAERFVKITDVIEPDKNRADYYRERIKVFARAFETIEPLFPDLS